MYEFNPYKGRDLQKFFQETPEFQNLDPPRENSFEPLCEKLEGIKTIIADKLREFSDNVNTQLMDPIVGKVSKYNIITATSSTFKIYF